MLGSEISSDSCKVPHNCQSDKGVLNQVFVGEIQSLSPNGITETVRPIPTSIEVIFPLLRSSFEVSKKVFEQVTDWIGDAVL